MNPPWTRKLAPKILDEAVKSIETVVTLQPINIFQKNINNAHDKYKDSIGAKLDSLSIIDTRSFGDVSADGDSAIMVFNNKHRYNWNSILIKRTPLQEKVFQQIIEKNLQTIGKNTLYNSGRYFVVVPTRHGNVRAEAEDGKAWDYYDLFSRKQQVNDIGAKTNVTLYFKTKTEAENFRKSVFTLFYKYMLTLFKKTTNSSLSSYPVMNDYKSEWTDERFYNEFNITKEEQKTIEIAMMPFK
jgi:hypothetical protein